MALEELAYREWRNKYTDCSNVLKNRIAIFEYLYYPGYWMYPYWDGLSIDFMTVNTAKSINSSHVKWIIHQSPTDENKVVIESTKEGYDDYYIDTHRMMSQI